ncbi:MAG: phosphoribosyl-ATP diphosphatase, partial [Kamptonema sp. SIO4C4]|nr:phosphoribosyl-ATP diphosphatase [Kamptonema sp. SIO4C4]
FLKDLPRDRVIAALDAKHGEVVTEGWTKRTGTGIEERIDTLREHVCGFLITFVEHEGRMQGIPLPEVERLVHQAGSVRLTVAGGVRSPEDVAAVDRLGADVQVGMALYTGAFDIAEGFAAPLHSDRPDGLIPTVVTDSAGRTLGLTYSSLESLRTAIDERRGVYYSRSRDEIWRKGESSGNKQTLLGIKADCDRDALRFIVRQEGCFCHLGNDTCFGGHSGFGALDKTVRNRVSNAPAGSYTRRLFDDADLLMSKLTEEARELAESTTREHAAAEAADLIYFATVAARKRGASLEDIETCLDSRSLKVTRRAGDAKPATPSEEEIK